MIRKASPEITDLLSRNREAIAAAAVVAFGLWLLAYGTGLLVPLLGLALLGLGIGWEILALRRRRFRQDGEAPGILRVTEGQIAYYGPRVGGFVGLPDLSEIRLLTLRGRRIWKLKQGDGQVLHIPVESDGAEALFDAFATLPGIDMPDLLAALGSDAPASDSRVVALAEVDRLIWARKGAGVVAV